MFDAPWTTFAAKLIRDAQASVVPVYFPGHNRRAFHLADNIAEPLLQALLLSEARHRFRKPLDAVVGNNLGWETLSQYDNRQSLTDYLYDQVQFLADTLPFTNVADLPTQLLAGKKTETPDLERTADADIELVWMTSPLPCRSR